MNLPKPLPHSRNTEFHQKAVWLKLPLMPSFTP
ncbi:Uncharacterised protein [Vibrio cholerae]|nr:Uncharacterised protein [Vibrio cholerae]